MVSRWWILPIFLLLTSCEKEVPKEPARPVKTIQISESSSLENSIIFPGTLRAFKRADLSFRVDGTVSMRPIYVGYEARKDEILVQLDPREYEIALQKAKAKVESIEAQLNFADRDYERMKNISERDPGAISVSLLDKRKETVEKLKAEWTMAQSDSDKAADDLSYTFLKAPFDGIVAAIYVENHEQLRAKQLVVRLLDVDDREMEINVPEKYINLLLEGRKQLLFKVRLDAFPDEVFTASIQEIGTEASSTTQTYPVTLTLQKIPPELSLLAGMSGRAFLSQPERGAKNSYKIPRSAIFTENGQVTYVWQVDPALQTVFKKAIQIDDNDKGEMVIVKTGLQPGDRIVTAGASFLTEGQRIMMNGEQPKP